MLDKVVKPGLPGTAKPGAIETADPKQLSKVMGMPHVFSGMSDPRGRVYSNTIMADLPVLTIIPGKPAINTLLRKGPDGKTLSDSELLEEVKKKLNYKEGGADETYDFLAKEWFHMKSDSKGDGGKIPDIRYFSFQADWKEYFAHVTVMVAFLAAQMGLKKFYNFNDAFEKQLIGGGLQYFVDKATSITESASNEYGESVLSVTKRASGLVNELRMMLGTEATAPGEEDMAAAERVKATEGMVGKIMAGSGDMMQTITSGANLIYPEIWKDSNFTKNYNITMKFSSPYGDPQSIFENVYIPFLSLLALSLPRQFSATGYSMPMVLKMGFPGWFASDMCIVSEVSFKRAEGDDDWAVNGLPLSIEVNLTVKDLYPTLMITKSFPMLTSNVGMAMYLQNMAGIRLEQPNLTGNVLSFVADKFGFISRGVESVKSTVGQNTSTVLNGIGNFIFNK
jgi:hypothetical protein